MSIFGHIRVLFGLVVLPHLGTMARLCSCAHNTMANQSIYNKIFLMEATSQALISVPESIDFFTILVSSTFAGHVPLNLNDCLYFRNCLYHGHTMHPVSEYLHRVQKKGQPKFMHFMKG